jgi:hypothetical protein
VGSEAGEWIEHEDAIARADRIANPGAKKMTKRHEPDYFALTTR